MGLFRKKPQPVWYVLKPTDRSASSSHPRREGPFTRHAIARLYADHQLPSDALLWTNERIFPNALRPNSSRPVRLMEWRRLDQLPDPVVRQLHADALALDHALPHQQHPHPTLSPPNQSHHSPSSSPSSPPSPPPSSPPPPPPPPPPSSLPGSLHHPHHHPAVYPHAPGHPAPDAQQPGPYPAAHAAHAAPIAPQPFYSQQPAAYPLHLGPHAPPGAPPPTLH
eukprot:gb/GEZJ01002941.1/.p1 GENE.gb/GEZJ01002941.1/~~gb/GEZJ01002941.1/.p1  ORF type:complete len:223 (+),score=33.04 gb/GEZJ01002941.1/:343-1011(+)